MRRHGRGADRPARPPQQRSRFERRPILGEFEQGRPRLGRTICRKPKPLIAVFSNGFGRWRRGSRRPRAAHPFRAASGSRCRSSRRCRAVRSRAPPPRRPSAPAWRESTSRRHRSGSSPASARSEARRPRSGRCRFAPRPGDRPSSPMVPTRPSADRRRLAGRRVGAPRQRPLPRLAAAERLARDLDQEAGAFGDAATPRGSRNCSPPASTVTRGATATSLASSTVPARDHAFAADARFDDLVAVDQRGPGLADPALDQPFRQSDIRPTSAAAASRQAAGRRRWNSCRRCGGHRLRHSPGAHSRRPCRAIRHGSA